jgi:hypothetical protein
MQGSADQAIGRYVFSRECPSTAMMATDRRKPTGLTTPVGEGWYYYTRKRGKGREREERGGGRRERKVKVLENNNAGGE